MALFAALLGALASAFRSRAGLVAENLADQEAPRRLSNDPGTHPTVEELQERVAALLEVQYRPRPCVYGYIRGKNIQHNAQAHVGRRWVLRVDLANRPDESEWRASLFGRTAVERTRKANTHLIDLETGDLNQFAAC